MDSSRMPGMMLRNELMSTTPSSQLQRPSTKQVFLTSRTDHLQERMNRFGELMKTQYSRPFYSSFRLSTAISAPLSISAKQFTIPADTLYNIHSHYANDTLYVYRVDLGTTEIVTIPPGRYKDVQSVTDAVNAAIPDQYLSFRYDMISGKVSAWFGEGVGSITTAEGGVVMYPSLFMTQQFGGLAEILGFSAMDSNYYSPESGMYSITVNGQIAGSPPKLWTFQQVFLHVDDHLGGVGRAVTDSMNEMMVSNSESGFDQVFQYYQGNNSGKAMAAQMAAPKGFHHALASVSLPTNFPSEATSMTSGNICLHNNAASEGLFIDRHFTHHSAQQYNNTILTQITVSFTNEFGQLLIGPPTVDYNVVLEITTLH